MASNYSGNELILCEWESVKKALFQKRSRQRRLRAAIDLLYDVDAAIRDHDHEHRRLMDANELVMPEVSEAYGEDLRFVRKHLTEEIDRLTSLTSNDRNKSTPATPSVENHDSPTPLSETRQPKADDLLSLKETAQLLGISYSTIRKKPLRTDLPTIKIGNRVLVRRSSLEKWLKDRERKMGGD